MKKTLSFCFCLCLLILSGCTPSPTAVTVGGRKVDASEYAFYLYSNRPDAALGLPVEEATAQAGAAALDQIATGEIVRLKCNQLGLSPSAQAEKEVADTKEALVQALGGKAAYLKYLNHLLLTDRCYDKLRMNQVYYQLLYRHITEETSQERYTDENMRRLFSDSYIRVKYIKLSLLDEEGKPLPSAALNDQKYLAEYIYMELTHGDADFDDMLTGFGSDSTMTENPGGLVLCPADAVGSAYLLAAFDLQKGEYRLLEETDACYIMTRADIPAGYYEENQAAIIDRAKADSFRQLMEQWKTETKVTVHRIVDKINLDNVREYVK